MKFVDALPETRGAHWREKWDAVARDLIENPGVWGIVQEGVTSTERIVSVRAALRKRGEFKVSQRGDVIYARYEGA